MTATKLPPSAPAPPPPPVRGALVRLVGVALWVAAAGFVIGSVQIWRALRTGENWGNYRGTGVNVLHVVKSTNQVTDDTVCLSEQSKSGKWFALADIATTSATANAGTWYNSGTSDPCTGATPASMNGWKTSF